MKKLIALAVFVLLSVPAAALADTVKVQPNEIAASTNTRTLDNFSTSNPMIANSTGNKFLGSRTSQATYIANGGNLSYGFDSDTWATGSISTNCLVTTVPEPATLALMGIGVSLSGAYLRRRKPRSNP